MLFAAGAAAGGARLKLDIVAAVGFDLGDGLAVYLGEGNCPCEVEVRKAS